MRLLACVLVVGALGELGIQSARPGPPLAVADQKRPNPDRLTGMKAAIAEIEAGKLKQQSWALPDPPWHRRYVELLSQECGVEWETVASLIQPAVQRVVWLDVTSLPTLVATDDDLVCNQEVAGSIPFLST
jgi:hypothetical protein